MKKVLCSAAPVECVASNVKNRNFKFFKTKKRNQESAECVTLQTKKKGAVI